MGGKEIKQHSLRILMAEDMKEDREECLQAGMNEYPSKPTEWKSYKKLWKMRKICRDAS